LYLRECRKVYTNSKIVADRLRQFNQLEPDGVLYPPLPRQHPFRPGASGDYLFYASRLTPIKRQDLAIEALRHTPAEVRLVIAGAPDVPGYLETLKVIEDAGNGRVVEPEPEALGEAMTALWKDRSRARTLGEEARHSLTRYRIDWENVVESLTR